MEYCLCCTLSCSSDVRDGEGRSVKINVVSVCVFVFKCHGRIKLEFQISVHVNLASTVHIRPPPSPQKQIQSFVIASFPISRSSSVIQVHHVFLEVPEGTASAS